MMSKPGWQECRDKAVQAGRDHKEIDIHEYNEKHVPAESPYSRRLEIDTLHMEKAIEADLKEVWDE